MEGENGRGRGQNVMEVKMEGGGRGKMGKDENGERRRSRCCWKWN